MNRFRGLALCSFCSVMFAGLACDSGAASPTRVSSKEVEVEPNQFAADRDPKPDAAKSSFDGERAVKYVKQLCEIGPRVSGSEGMKKQQALLIQHFESHGGVVTKQEFTARQRSRVNEVAMTNLVISWHPKRTKRVILCSHYDTRPMAHEEVNRDNWTKPFVSANDGTSGVALLMELAPLMKDLPTNVGIDFVLFDGEEYVFDMGVPAIRDGDKYFFGSEHFAGLYKKERPRLPFQYTAAILLDLCCAADARLAVEGFSWEFAPLMVREVWDIAAKQGAKSFKFEQGFHRAARVTDDHLALNEVGIPAIDIIDFDYPDWHKLTDTPDKISAKQTAEVANVLLAWLKQQK
jgi:glutaminyl-peptide cyclotransferase